MLVLTFGYEPLSKQESAELVCKSVLDNDCSYIWRTQGQGAVVVEQFKFHFLFYNMGIMVPLIGLFELLASP
jgi:hypothetical protein